uniref:Uncharacterized protein n=1 Tax=Fagus sylvatica TaxID=28930 RepID=A0A2N9FS77_FAGSY
MQQVFYKRPWTIKGAHLILKEWSPGPSMGRGKEVGIVKEVELNEENVHSWNWFIRVRIDVEVSRPLKHGIFLPRKGLKDLWIGLKYEKLPDLYLKCGIMGHESRFCGCQPSTLSNEHGFRFLAFGPWMRTENDLSPPGHDEGQVRQKLWSGIEVEDIRMAKATLEGGSTEGGSTVLHDDSPVTNLGSKAYYHSNTLEIVTPNPTKCQPVKTKPTQIFPSNNSPGFAHKALAVGPLPINTHIQLNSKPHTQTTAHDQPNSLTNPIPSQALSSTLLSPDPPNSASVDLSYPIPKPKWKKLARNISISLSSVPNLRLLGTSKRKTEVLSTQDEDAAPCLPKQRRLNVSLEDDLSFSAVAARQSCLAMLWSSDITVSVRSYSPRHIDAEIILENGVHWRFTGFYGNPEHHRRTKSWNLMRRLGAECSLPWLVCGDFNEIMDNGEKLGFRSRAQRLMANFREALTNCELSDLGFQGPKFTWSNLQSNENVIFAKLDRGVSTRKWLRLFPATRVRIIPFVPSDHHAVMVDCNVEAIQPYRKKHQFRFEAMWVKREGCEEVIKKAWEAQQEGTRMFQLCQKIKGCRMALIQ